MSTARDEWREYHRAVRVIRRLRIADEFTYRRFSSCWWLGRYQYEHKNVSKDMGERLNRARHATQYLRRSRK